MSDEIVFDDATLNKLHSVASGTCTAMRDKWAATITDDNKMGLLMKWAARLRLRTNSSWSVADNKTKSNCLMKFIDMMGSTHDKKMVEEIRRLNKFEAESNHWKANHACEVERARVLKERPDMPLERIKAYDRMVELEEENKRLRARMEVLMSAEMMQNNLNMISAMLHSIQSDTNQTRKLLCDRFNVQGYY
ncbi:hypothetical protein ALHIDCOG_00196 [Klebsiella phage CPRSB]|nr:hypothetical protein ALHIDCOG_00196 [Klebsiella phage CPRSB]